MNINSLKLGGTKDHVRQVKVPGTAPYWKAWIIPTSVWDINCQLKCHAPCILRIQIEAALY